MNSEKRTISRVFDIRNIIGALLGIYGILLTISGLAPGLVASHDDNAGSGNTVDLYIGNDANWWVGITLIAVAAVFTVWAAMRPVTVEVDSEQHTQDG